MNINGDMKPIDEGAGEDKQRKRLAFVLPKELEIKGKIKKYEPNSIIVSRGDAADSVYFIKEGSVPPWYFEKSYFLNTEGKSKAYNLFYEALKKTKRVALIKTVIGPKFYYGILKLVDNGIILTTLYFEEEVHIPEKEMNSKITSKELDLAIKLIESMKGDFEPNKYKDEYQDRIKKAIDEKLDGKKITKIKRNSKKQINDLMKALEKSLKDAK